MFLLRTYTRMLPVLQAQQQLRDIASHRLAAASPKKAGPVLRRLSRQAEEPGPKKAATPSDLASRGVTVRSAPQPGWAASMTGGGG